MHQNELKNVIRMSPIFLNEVYLTAWLNEISVSDTTNLFTYLIDIDTIYVTTSVKHRWSFQAHKQNVV